MVQLTSDSSLTTSINPKQKIINPKFIKMKSLMIVTVACFLVLTFTTRAFAVTCTDLSNSGSDLFNCATDYATNPDSICSGTCKDLLFKYADECLGTQAAADAYKEGINTVCEPNVCSEATTPGSDLLNCIRSYATDPDSVCSGDCNDELLEYADECLGVGADTYKDTLNTVCRGKGDNGSAEDDATRMGATLFSTISALLVAVFAALY